MFLTNIPSYPSGMGTFRFQGGNIGDVISYILPIIFIGAGIVLLIGLIGGGFKLLTSGGNPKIMAAGQKRLTNSLIGFLIVIASWWIMQMVGVILDVNITGGTGALPANVTCDEACEATAVLGCRTQAACDAADGWIYGTTIECGAPEFCCCQN